MRPDNNPQPQAPTTGHFPSDQALPAKTAALILGLSYKTLNNWRCQGKGPRFQKAPGAQGAVRYPLSELRAWRAQNMRRSTSDTGGNNAH